MEKDPGPGHEGVYSHSILGMHIRDGGHVGKETDWKYMLDFADAHFKSGSRKEKTE
jgi:hypothetical protein